MRELASKLIEKSSVPALYASGFLRQVAVDL